MKVLVISRNPWDDANSIGNTLSNFFKGVDDIEFASIYFRTSSPNNRLCKRYYRVTETEVLKKWFHPERIGKAFAWSREEGVPSTQSAAKKEQKLVKFIHKYNLKLAYGFSNYIWNTKKWLNHNLREFIVSFAPDVMVTFVKSAPQYYLTIKYLRENFQLPLFTWIADDEYTQLHHQHSNEEIERLRYILSESTVVRGCSEEICDYYNSVFSCNATPLYKGCDLTTPVNHTVNQPVTLVYAGNLLYGRLDIIRKISDALENYSDNKQKALLEIYSNTPLSAEEQAYFDQKACSRYMGKQDYETIVQRLVSADVVLHVESFEADQILKTRYSFSTKIIDCLQSGRILLAVGPGEIASIDYVKKIPGAYVIEDLEYLDAELSAFLADTETFGKRAEQIREFAQLYHDVAKNAEEMKDILKKTVNGE